MKCFRFLNNELEIKGGTDDKPENRKLKYGEFTQHPYYRKVIVGNDVDREKIAASFENGVLTLVL